MFNFFGGVLAEKAGNALISVFDKSGIEEFANNLSDLGWKIYASGGTATAIKKAGIEVIDTAMLSRGGEILGHRVVTLSREIYAGILANDTSEHNQELKELKIPRIDLVCVDVYPLIKEISNPKSNEQLVTEKTDVGGPTLLHAAAKSRRIVASKPSQRVEIISWLKNGRPNEKEFIKTLASDAEYEVANYMIQSANYLGDGQILGSIGKRIASPAYGENPWQKGAGLFVPTIQDDQLAIDKFDLIEGIPLSYNNFTDIDRLLQTITHIAAGFDKNFNKVPAIALGAKHGNVCGASYGNNKKIVIENMLDGDKRAIFGGSVMSNFPINQELAETILYYQQGKGKRILDIIIAPSIDESAKKILNRKNGKLRLFINPALSSLNQVSLDKARRVRYVRGGELTQDNYTYVVDCKSKDIEKNTGEPSKVQMTDMLLAWAVGVTSSSNTICIVKNGKLLSNGVGQQDRVTAAELALLRAKNAGHDLRESSAYSDSFFPFSDGPKLLADAGISAIFTTRGSIKDDEVAEEMTKAGVLLCTLPDVDARGFYGH